MLFRKQRAISLCVLSKDMKYRQLLCCYKSVSDLSIFSPCNVPVGYEERGYKHCTCL